MLTLMGPVAHFLPGQESEVNQLIPDTPEFDLTLRALFSKDAASFATGTPDVRQIRLDNAAVLGGVLDDNSAAISILRAGLGIVTGGELADKNFPAPDPTLALPTEENGPLYRWNSYRRVGNPVQIPLNDSGDPYTTRESEVSSLRELARTLFQGPSNFVEQYFPTRLLTDVAAGTPEDFPDMRYDGIGSKPGLLVQAGDSDTNAAAPDTGPPHPHRRPERQPAEPRDHDPRLQPPRRDHRGPHPERRPAGSISAHAGELHAAGHPHGEPPPLAASSRACGISPSHARRLTARAKRYQLSDRDVCARQPE